jgi:hypothetical protein
MAVRYAAPYHHRSTPTGIMFFDGTLMITFMKASSNADLTICEVLIESWLIANHGIAQMSKLPCLMLCSQCSSEESVFSSHPHSHYRTTRLL